MGILLYWLSLSQALFGGRRLQKGFFAENEEKMVEEKLKHRRPVAVGGVLIIMCLGVAYAWGVFRMNIKLLKI